MKKRLSTHLAIANMGANVGFVGVLLPIGLALVGLVCGFTLLGILCVWALWPPARCCLGLRSKVLGSYVGPCPPKEAFNKCVALGVAKPCVTNKHYSGVLKYQWLSLKEIWTQLEFKSKNSWMLLKINSCLCIIGQLSDVHG